MFNMIEIGRRIAELRKKQNMTQMELADKLNISFQAVSNWERGNSMPDISKLPEISAIFDISIDALLGERADFLNAVLEEKTEEYLKKETASAEEIADTLPLLKPTQVEEVAKHVDFSNHVDIGQFLPFMDEDDIAEFAFKAAENGEPVDKFLPFMDNDDIMKLAKLFQEKNRAIDELFPFMYEDDVAEFAFKAAENGEPVDKFLPFMDSDDVKKLLLKIMKKS